jgi:hypothetical protein
VTSSIPKGTSVSLSVNDIVLPYCGDPYSFQISSKSSDNYPIESAPVSFDGTTLTKMALTILAFSSDDTSSAATATYNFQFTHPGVLADTTSFKIYLTVDIKWVAGSSCTTLSGFGPGVTCTYNSADNTVRINSPFSGTRDPSAGPFKFLFAGMVNPKGKGTYPIQIEAFTSAACTYATGSFSLIIDTIATMTALSVAPDHFNLNAYVTYKFSVTPKTTLIETGEYFHLTLPVSISQSASIACIKESDNLISISCTTESPTTIKVIVNVDVVLYPTNRNLVFSMKYLGNPLTAGATTGLILTLRTITDKDYEIYDTTVLVFGSLISNINPVTTFANHLRGYLAYVDFKISFPSFVPTASILQVDLSNKFSFLGNLSLKTSSPSMTLQGVDQTNRVVKLAFGTSNIPNAVVSFSLTGNNPIQETIGSEDIKFTLYVKTITNPIFIQSPLATQETFTCDPICRDCSTFYNVCTLCSPEYDLTATTCILKPDYNTTRNKISIKAAEVSAPFIFLGIALILTILLFVLGCLCKRREYWGNALYSLLRINFLVAMVVYTVLVYLNEDPRWFLYCILAILGIHIVISVIGFIQLRKAIFTGSMGVQLSENRFVNAFASSSKKHNEKHKEEFGKLFRVVLWSTPVFQFSLMRWYFSSPKGGKGQFWHYDTESFTYLKSILQRYQMVYLFFVLIALIITTSVSLAINIYLFKIEMVALCIWDVLVYVIAYFELNPLKKKVNKEADWENAPLSAKPMVDNSEMPLAEEDQSKLDEENKPHSSATDRLLKKLRPNDSHRPDHHPDDNGPDQVKNGGKPGEVVGKPNSFRKNDNHSSDQNLLGDGTVLDNGDNDSKNLNTEIYEHSGNKARKPEPVILPGNLEVCYDKEGKPMINSEGKLLVKDPSGKVVPLEKQIFIGADGKTLVIEDIGVVKPPKGIKEGPNSHPTNPGIDKIHQPNSHGDKTHPNHPDYAQKPQITDIVTPNGNKFSLEEGVVKKDDKGRPVIVYPDGTTLPYDQAMLLHNADKPNYDEDAITNNGSQLKIGQPKETPGAINPHLLSEGALSVAMRKPRLIADPYDDGELTAPGEERDALGRLVHPHGEDGLKYSTDGNLVTSLPIKPNKITGDKDLKPGEIGGQRTDRSGKTPRGDEDGEHVTKEERANRAKDPQNLLDPKDPSNKQGKKAGTAENDEKVGKDNTKIGKNNTKPGKGVTKNGEPLENSNDPKRLDDQEEPKGPGFEKSSAELEPLPIKMEKGEDGVERPIPAEPLVERKSLPKADDSINKALEESTRNFSSVIVDDNGVPQSFNSAHKPLSDLPSNVKKPFNYVAGNNQLFKRWNMDPPDGLGIIYEQQEGEDATLELFPAPATLEKKQKIFWNKVDKLEEEKLRALEERNLDPNRPDGYRQGDDLNGSPSDNPSNPSKNPRKKNKPKAYLERLDENGNLVVVPEFPQEKEEEGREQHLKDYDFNPDDYPDTFPDNNEAIAEALAANEAMNKKLAETGRRANKQFNSPSNLEFEQEINNPEDDYLTKNDQLELQPDGRLLSINGQSVADIYDGKIKDKEGVPLDLKKQAPADLTKGHLVLDDGSRFYAKFNSINELSKGVLRLYDGDPVLLRDQTFQDLKRGILRDGAGNILEINGQKIEDIERGVLRMQNGTHLIKISDQEVGQLSRGIVVGPNGNRIFVGRGQHLDDLKCGLIKSMDGAVHRLIDQNYRDFTKGDFLDGALKKNQETNKDKNKKANEMYEKMLINPKIYALSGGNLDPRNNLSPDIEPGTRFGGSPNKQAGQWNDPTASPEASLQTIHNPETQKEVCYFDSDGNPIRLSYLPKQPKIYDSLGNIVQPGGGLDGKKFFDRDGQPMSPEEQQKAPRLYDKRGRVVRFNNIGFIHRFYDRTGQLADYEKLKLSYSLYDCDGQMIKIDLLDRQIPLFDPNGNLVNLRNRAEIPDVLYDIDRNRLNALDLAKRQRLYDAEGNVLTNFTLMKQGLIYDKKGKQIGEIINPDELILPYFLDRDGCPIDLREAVKGFLYYDQKNEPITREDLERNSGLQDWKGRMFRPDEVYDIFENPNDPRRLYGSNGREIKVEHHIRREMIRDELRKPVELEDIRKRGKLFDAEGKAITGKVLSRIRDLLVNKDPNGRSRLNSDIEGEELNADRAKKGKQDSSILSRAQRKIVTPVTGGKHSKKDGESEYGGLDILQLNLMADESVDIEVNVEEDDENGEMNLGEIDLDNPYDDMRITELHHPIDASHTASSLIKPHTRDGFHPNPRHGYPPLNIDNDRSEVSQGTVFRNVAISKIQTK